MRLKFFVACVAALAVLGGQAATASAAGGKRLQVGVRVTGFQAKGNNLEATGVATANLIDRTTGQTFTTKQKVNLTADTGRGCLILHLNLDQLNLVLLGLNAHLDKVNLDVTGKRSGGVLGKLFCRLASSDIKSSKAKAAAARSLTRAVRHHPLKPIAFSTAISPVANTAQAPVCNVLALNLGPLNLELLGLVVDLDKVNLVVTATPGGGALGNLFCSLAV